MIDGAGDFHLVLTPEIGLFALCALIGDFLPLKVFTRGAEGEITTSTCFMFAALLAGGPLAALIALVVANVVVDVHRRKEAMKLAFNIAQLRDHRRPRPARCSSSRRACRAPACRTCCRATCSA